MTNKKVPIQSLENEIIPHMSVTTNNEFITPESKLIPEYKVII